MQTTQDCDLDFLRKLLHQLTGIQILPDQEYLVVARIAPLLRRAGMGSTGELVRHFRQAPESPMRGQLIEAMTNHETSFFRDVSQFQALKDDILPELIARKGDNRKLNIWSAACSTGQEPYSVAMLLHDHFYPRLSDWKIRILATDISDQVLRTARAGQYTQPEVNRGLPAPLLVRHFRKQDLSREIAARLRQLTEFRQRNLIEPFAGLPKMDIVLLRNILIYFDDETRKRILLNVNDVLVDGGYLMLGVGESPRSYLPEFETVLKNDTVCFRKPIDCGGH